MHTATGDRFISWQFLIAVVLLQGRYGLCRFLRDGYKTPREVSFRSQ